MKNPLKTLTAISDLLGEAKKTRFSALDEIFDSLEEGDFFHTDARRDLRHDKVAAKAAASHKPAASCPPGQMRNKATGHCTSLRGKVHR